MAPIRWARVPAALAFHSSNPRAKPIHRESGDQNGATPPSDWSISIGLNESIGRTQRRPKAS
jgi:hypothetical protein